MQHVLGNAPLTPSHRGLVQRLLIAYTEFKDSIRATVPVFDARKPSPEMSRGQPAPDVDLPDLDADGNDRTTRTRGAIRVEDVMKTARVCVQT